MKAAFLVVFPLLLLIASPAVARSASLPRPDVDYAADTLMTVDDGSGSTTTIPGRIYVSGDRERRESRMLGRESIVIHDRSQGTVWILVPEQRMYMEGGGHGDHDPAEALASTDIELTRLGAEQVNGIDSVKYRMRARDREGTVSEGLIWLTSDHVPVKFDVTSQTSGRQIRARMECSNLKIGRQNPQLFELPAGYQRLQMPSGMGGLSAPAPPAGQGAPPGPPGQVPAGEMERYRQQMQETLKRLQQMQQQ